MAACLWQSLRSPRRDDRPSLSPVQLLLVGAWFGIVTGLIELGGTVAAVKLAGRVTYDTLRTNWHYSWMIPLSNLFLFSAFALVYCLASLRLPRLRTDPLAFVIFAFLSAWALVAAIPSLHKPAEAILAMGLACMTMKFLARRREGFLRLAPRMVAAGAMTVVMTAAWDVSASRWGGDSDRRTDTISKSEAPNVLLIVLDTVRADSLSSYGAERDATPNLARLAREGVLFKHARSTAPWTLPAHASLFTSRWPFELTADVGRPLDESYPTMAELLATRGYATGGFVANTQNCNAWYGLDRGFEHYEDFYENAAVTPVEVIRSSQLGRYVGTSAWGRPLLNRLAGPLDYRYRKSAAMINRDALAWLSKQEGQPYFLFLNYFDVHDPYIPPPDAERRFSRRSGESQSAENLARNAYDDCLRYLDDQIGRLLSELDHRGKLENTLILVTADHGEGFGEHGLAGHGVSLYRSELHIPLILAHPTLLPTGAEVTEPVSLRDVAPTILDVLGLATAPSFAGLSLSGTWNESISVAETRVPVLSEVDRADHVPDEVEDAPARRGRMRSLVADGRTYILNGDGSEELYDLHDDPEESNDLADLVDAQEHLTRLRGLLEQMTTNSEKGE